MADKTITLTKEFVDGLKKAYNKAVSEKAESFTYSGHEFVTGYAKYLIQACTPNFKEQHEND